MDCWDRNKSIAVYPEEVKTLKGVDVLPPIKSFHLSSDVLDEMPEDERFIFVVDNTDVKNIFIHRRIVGILSANMSKV